MAKRPKSRTARSSIPTDPKELAQWLGPRPDETWEQWSRRFDRADRIIRDCAAPGRAKPRRRSAKRNPGEGRTAA